MEFKTNFQVGDELVSMTRYLKIVTFKVKKVIVTATAEETEVSYMAEGGYDTYDERLCFRSEDELFAYIKAL